jgi:uncharacterized repeat protein (TIGR01451 family)
MFGWTEHTERKNKKIKHWKTLKIFALVMQLVVYQSVWPLAAFGADSEKVDVETKNVSEKEKDSESEEDISGEKEGDEKKEKDKRDADSEKRDKEEKERRDQESYKKTDDKSDKKQDESGGKKENADDSVNAEEDVVRGESEVSDDENGADNPEQEKEFEENEKEFGEENLSPEDTYVFEAEEAMFFEEELELEDEPADDDEREEMVERTVSGEANEESGELVEVTEEEEKLSTIDAVEDLPEAVLESSGEETALLGEADEEGVAGECEGELCLENEAEGETRVSSVANTGNNEVEMSEVSEEGLGNEEKRADLSTGDAVALTSATNEVNTTILGGNWQEFVLDLYGYVTEDINVLQMFSELVKNIVPSSDSQTTHVDADIVHEADVVSDVSAEAVTGQNRVGNEAGAVNITTGDAKAQADLVNVANTTLVGDNWLFGIINVFDTWTGNLIVPGEGVIELPGSGYISLFDVRQQNDADILNIVGTTAETGKNSVSGTDANLVTGEAVAEADAFNMVNTTLLNENQFLLTVNALGAWTGKALNWDRENGHNGLFGFDFKSEDCLLECGVKSYNLDISNTADVNNTVNALAVTGENNVESGGVVDIHTGEAMAESHVVNFVNNTVLGNNWLYLLVNVLGTWTGDVDFAYPDVRVNVSDGRTDAKTGDILVYALDYANAGKAAAQDVTLELVLPEKVSYVGHSGGEAFRQDGNVLRWTVEEIPAGISGTVTVTTQPNENWQEDDEFVATARIATATAEQQQKNNVAVDTTLFHFIAPAASIVWLEEESEERPVSQLSLEYAPVAQSSVRPGESAAYTLVVRNTGATPLAGVEVESEVKYGQSTVALYTWPIGMLQAGEAAQIDYAFQMGMDALVGIYVSQATAVGTDPWGEIRKTVAPQVALEVLRNPVSVVAFPPVFSEVSPETNGETSVPTDQLSAPAEVLGEQRESAKKPAVPWWVFTISLAFYSFVANRNFFVGSG